LGCESQIPGLGELTGHIHRFTVIPSRRRILPPEHAVVNFDWTGAFSEKWKFGDP
jgi:hypothetical protein